MFIKLNLFCDPLIIANIFNYSKIKQKLNSTIEFIILKNTTYVNLIVRNLNPIFERFCFFTS